MTELSDDERQIILALIQFAWKQGGIRSPEQAVDVERIRVKLAKDLNGRLAQAEVTKAPAEKG